MNPKVKKKYILLLVLLLIILVSVGIYTAYRLHHEDFAGKNDIITRGEFAADLAKELKLDISKLEKSTPSFYDIGGNWVEKYIEALIDAGIIDPADYPDGFKPDEPITRAEIIKMMVRAKGQDKEAKNTKGHSGYDDQADIKDGDKGYVIVSKEDGIIGDTKDSKIHPNNPITKKEADDIIDKAKLKPDTLVSSPSLPAKDTNSPTPTPATSTPKDSGSGQTTPNPPATGQIPSTPTSSPSPKPPAPTPGSGSGGGSYSIPDAQIRFDLPENAHTDTEIRIMSVWKYMQSFSWKLTKTAVDGSEQPVELANTVIGLLGLEGGTIQFKDNGKYTLTAVAKNARGKETVLSKTVTVYPVINLAFDLPETTHTDKSATLTFSAEKLYDHVIAWTAEKDGEAAQLSDILDGKLGNEGGTFVFKSKGKYKLTASITDETGRVFSYTETTKVYPVAGVEFELPATSHTDKTVEVTPILTKADGLSVVWSLIKNGEPATLADELEGTLTDSGGKIRFKDKGVYLLTGTLTDEIGRSFEASQTITVYPVGVAGFYLPEIAHTDTNVVVKAAFQNLGTAKVQWSLTRSGEPVSITDCIDGTLTDTESTIRFQEKGEYILKAEFTDPAGRNYSYTSSIKVYPVPTITYKLPSNAHTDTLINVAPQTSELGNLKVEWLLENGFGFQNLATYIDGTLDNSGGTIRFKHDGTYELIARITDETGRVFLYEDGGKIEILPVLDISFELPDTTHTDHTIDIRTRGNNNVLPVEWTLVKDGGAVSFSDELETGSLNAYGGKIQFKNVGNYTLTASMTDALGRVFSYSVSTNVYPIPTISIDLPQTWYAGKTGTISVTGTDLEKLTADWTIIQGDCDAKPYNIYTSGSLTKEGGSLTFRAKGQYELILTMTDSTGRTFVRSQSFSVFPIPVVSISLPQTWHAGEAGMIKASGMDLENLTADWTIKKDNGDARSYSAYASGILTKDGGMVTFPSKGQYELILTLTDINGRAFIKSQSLTVYPIPTIDIGIPQTWYAGEAGGINVSGTDLENFTENWTICQGGDAEPYSTYASGTLTKAGGSLAFPIKGQYELILTLTDPTGRTFAESKSFTVYPIPSMSLGISSFTYSGEAMAVTAYGSELDEASVDWLISVDGSEAKAYKDCASGTLGINGGTLRIITDKTISVKIQTVVTDANGRKFIFSSKAATVKPIASFAFTVPSSAHIGSGFNVTLPTTSGLEGRTLLWSLTKDGNTVSYSGNLSNIGGTIAISATGNYVLTASTTDSAGRIFTYPQSINITNNAPNKPSGSASVTRISKDGRLLVNLYAYASDPDGDVVTLEYSGNTSDSYYAVGSHTVKVRARDAWGLCSDWTDISFNVANSAPTTPVITRTPDGNSIAPGVPITITASSIDPDGDSITYVWEGRPAQTSSAYPLGKNVVRVKAVDATGAESPWAAIVFFVADPNKGGGMTLTGPESVILEQGIAGATITNYTFTVPPVSGHSGNDLGRIRGYNILTSQWDQLDYATTTNGITFTRTLTAGIYSQLEFYYYTNHDCMYNKSNITYSVTFYFQ